MSNILPKKYAPFYGKQIVIVLRGTTTFGYLTSEGNQVQSNCFMGYLIAEDATDLYVSPESPDQHTALINKTEVALLSIAPESDELTVEFSSDFEESDLN